MPHSLPDIRLCMKLSASMLRAANDEGGAYQAQAKLLDIAADELAKRHDAAAVFVTEVERAIAAGRMPFAHETMLRTRANAMCREFGFIPIWQQENVSLADLDTQLERLDRVMAGAAE